MLLLHGWKKIKKLLPFFTHSGLNKLYISLASLGEIKNLFVPCSFRAGNNFFIFFHPCNNTPLWQVVVYFWFHLTRLERRFLWCSLGESHFCRKDLHYYTVVFSANSLTKYRKFLWVQIFAFLNNKEKSGAKKLCTLFLLLWSLLKRKKWFSFQLFASEKSAHFYLLFRFFTLCGFVQL